MKKIILFLLLVSVKLMVCQNGFSTYTTTLPTGATPQSETCIYVDNAGNKWVGFFNGASNSAAAFGVYKIATNSWTYYNATNTPILVYNKVTCFKEDNLGNMWIGTTTGLLKFDGTNFTKFTTTNGLPSNYITSLDFISNMLYIGTGGGGISRFDGITFTNYNPNNFLFPLSSVMCIRAENANTIWAVQGHNLIKFSINSSYTSTSYTMAMPTTTAYSFTDIYIDGYGNKWLNDYNGPVKFNNSGFTYFNTMYPNFSGGHSVGSNLIKGPNNGVLALVNSYMNYNYNYLAEFLPNNQVKFYYPQNTIKLGKYLSADVGGKIAITSTVSSISPYSAGFHSLNFSGYSPFHAFGQILYDLTPDNFKTLDINRVKAGIANRGDMHWDIGGSGNAFYEVPKGSSVNSNFASAIWMGGLDASNQLHTAAQMYRQTGTDFWPGPLDTLNGAADTISAVNYDKIWKVSYNDINTFINQFNLGNVPLTYTPTPDIVNWPAHGTGNKAKQLAPFVDVNGDGIYKWQDGDYPKIKGDQTLYFIFNDNLGPHTETGGLPFGVEVHCMAYAYGCPNVINGRNELAYTTFYDYKIYNRSNTNYHDIYFGYWSDVDLGNYNDDYIGSHPQTNLGFCYNSDPYDEQGAGVNGYDTIPPAIGLTVLKGPYANTNDLIDNDNDSIIDELGEQCLMSNFDFFNNNIGTFPVSSTNPSNKYHYNNYLRGRWKDSTFFTCGGNAYGGTIPTKYVFPWTNYQNNPCGTWTETTAGNFAGDRRFVLSSGPFNLPAKGNTEVEYALVWSVDSSATSNVNLASVNKLIADAQKVRNFYNGNIPTCLQKMNIGVKENSDLSSQIQLYPNPANNFIQIKSESLAKNVILEITDLMGRTLMSQKTDDLNQSVININNLNDGIYFLNIKFDNSKSVTKKFVKQ